MQQKVGFQKQGLFGLLGSGAWHEAPVTCTGCHHYGRLIGGAYHMLKLMICLDLKHVNIFRKINCQDTPLLCEEERSQFYLDN